MNLICPVCNGLSPLRATCPACGEEMHDMGRLSDFYSDYSPYRPIDDLKRTNGLSDLANQVCVHLGWCPLCRDEEQIAVAEWSEADVSALDGHMQERE